MVISIISRYNLLALLAFYLVACSSFNKEFGKLPKCHEYSYKADTIICNSQTYATELNYCIESKLNIEALSFESNGNPFLWCMYDYSSAGNAKHILFYTYSFPKQGTMQTDEWVATYIIKKDKWLISDKYCFDKQFLLQIAMYNK